MLLSLFIVLISLDKTVKLVLVLFDNDKEENEGEECDMCVHYHYHNCHGAKEHLLMWSWKFMYKSNKLREVLW